MKVRAVEPAKAHRKRLIGTALAAAAAGALAWVTVADGAPAQESTGSGPVVSVADEAPGYAVENFNYPQADKILAEKNIVLKRGDGHITLADCVTGTGQLEVMARDRSKVCFDVKGTSGWLTLELPSVYLIKGNDYTTQADMTVDTEEQTYDIEKNTWTPVGETADEQTRKWTLVELRTSK
ncbi:hypothetical protein RB628_27405 [Streptomyces sp. ADMS]|uniref:hypothetical protein n=1 Tax=Streptomyces sp. ADMS TaxID=3071415 RepID=UPI00296FEF1B|nr:hypothetical protein [Streptomyces sp. ADMS]MDW4908964.1 hypothetical protein [Streptomyces sp. ADMS]